MCKQYELPLSRGACDHTCRILPGRQNIIPSDLSPKSNFGLQEALEDVTQPECIVRDNGHHDIHLGKTGGGIYFFWYIDYDCGCCEEEDWWSGDCCYVHGEIDSAKELAELLEGKILFETPQK